MRLRFPTASRVFPLSSSCASCGYDMSRVSLTPERHREEIVQQPRLSLGVLTLARTHCRQRGCGTAGDDRRASLIKLRDRHACAVRPASSPRRLDPALPPWGLPRMRHLRGADLFQEVAATAHPETWVAKFRRKSLRTFRPNVQDFYLIMVALVLLLYGKISAYMPMVHSIFGPPHAVRLFESFASNMAHWSSEESRQSRRVDKLRANAEVSRIVVFSRDVGRYRLNTYC
ncbi:hypothetical protein EDD22DRAFT_304354 [Suillus occidentalis]|nr:hypothetical protein EDD22DRAFT_304354 [Suillus occidentalis]